MRKLQIKFPDQIRIFGWDFGSSARAMNQVGKEDSLITYEFVTSTQADLRIVRGLTFFERKQMSTKTSIKRIALVAVSALGFGLLSVIPAKADASNVAAASGSTTVVRTDIASDSATLTIEANGAIAAGSTLTLGSFTRNGLSLGSQVPTGFTWDWTDANTSALGQAHGGTEAGASAGSALGHKTTSGAAAALASGDDIAVVTIANTAAQGTYTFTMDSSETDETAVTFTVYVAGAPAAVVFDATSYTAVASANAAATLTVKDSGGNRSYLNSGEALQVTSSSTSATTSVVLVDSGNYTKAVASAGGLSTNLTSATAGTYTFTAASAVNTLTVTSASATLTVTAAPVNVATVTVASGQLVIGHETDTDTNDMLAATQTDEDLSLFLDLSQKSLTLNLAETAATTAGNFEVTLSQTSGVPFPGGVSAVAATLIPTTVDSDGTGSTATYTVTASTALAGTGYTVTVNGATDLVIKVLYQAKQAYDIDLVDANASTIAATELSTSSQSVIVKDQFGAAMSGATVTYTTSGRNTVAVKTAVTGADGKVTISTTDAAATTSTSDDTLTANIATGDIPGAGAQDTSAATTIKYYDDVAGITPSAVALTVTQPGTPGTTGTYDTTRASTATISVTADTNLDNSAGNNAVIKDQIAISANVKNAATTNIHGVAVSVSVSTGAYVLCSGTLGEVPVGSQTGAATSCTSYTDSSGNYAFQVGFTKAGTATVTVTSGSVTATRSVTVVAADKAIVSAATSGSVVTATVTDLWGNAVSGAQVTFTAASGALLGGNFASLTSNTGADGTTSATVTTSTTGSYVVTAAISGGDSAVAADATNGVPAGVASATATVTVAASTAKTADDAYTAAVTAGTKADAAGTKADAAKASADAATLQAEANAKTIAALTDLVKQLIADKVTSDAATAAAIQDVLDMASDANDNASSAIDAANLASEAADAATSAAQDAGDAVAALAEQVTAAQDISTEAVEAANAATDAANAAAEAADNAGSVAQDAVDAANAATAAVTALGTQLAAFSASVKAQITTLTNLVVKIQKKVKA